MTATQNAQMMGEHVSRSRTNDGIDMLFKCNENHFYVIIPTQTPPDSGESGSIGRGYLDRLDDCDWDGYPPDFPSELADKSDAIWDEIQDLVQLLCQPLFKELASTEPEPTGRRKDLHSYMNPELIQFRLVSVNGEPKLVSCPNAAPIVFHPPLPDSTLVNANLPRFPSSSIEVLNILARRWFLTVLVEGQPMSCKITTPVYYDCVSRELACLQLISEAGLSPPLRVPSIKGIVEASNEGGGIVGILMEYIKPAIPSLREAFHEGADFERPRKEKWAAQIEETLSRLHSIGVVWSNATTGNILIDEKDDAWILDFGGGHTKGWVDYHLAGTKEGDLQALTRIKEALGVH